MLAGWNHSFRPEGVESDDWQLGGEEVHNTAFCDVVLAAVEIKTKIAASSLGRAVAFTSVDVLLSEVGDETVREYVPREHMAQVIRQRVVLGFKSALYAAAAYTRLFVRIF